MNCVPTGARRPHFADFTPSVPLLTAVRPPELAPRLPYAALLLVADRVVLADTFRFSRQSGHSRMRIRTSQGAQWLSVPRVHTGRQPVLNRVEVVDDGWRRRHLAGLRAAYGMAPFYEHVAPGWAEVLATPGSLADLTCASVRWAAGWLGARAEIVRASALPGAPASLADVAAEVRLEALVTLPESAERDAQAVPGAAVRVLEVDEVERRQAFPGFEPGLSVLDVVMNHGTASAEVIRAGIR